MKMKMNIRSLTLVGILVGLYPLCGTAALYHNFIGSTELYIHDDNMNVYAKLSPEEFGGSTEFISAKRDCDCLEDNVYRGEIKTDKGLFELDVSSAQQYVIKPLAECYDSVEE